MVVHDPETELRLCMSLVCSLFQHMYHLFSISSIFDTSYAPWCVNSALIVPTIQYHVTTRCITNNCSGPGGRSARHNGHTCLIPNSRSFPTHSAWYACEHGRRRTLAEARLSRHIAHSSLSSSASAAALLSPAACSFFPPFPLFCLISSPPVVPFPPAALAFAD